MVSYTRVATGYALFVALLLALLAVAAPPAGRAAKAALFVGCDASHRC